MIRTLILANLLGLLVAGPVMAAELSNVGPRGDAQHSGDLNARRYQRMYDRWKDEPTQNTDLQARYEAAPQAPLLAQQDPYMQAPTAPTPMAQPTTLQPLGAMYLENQAQQQAVAPAPVYRAPAGNMMPPVVIEGNQFQ